MVSNRSFIFNFEMKLFIKKIFFSFLLPLLVLVVSVFYWDPFKVFFSYEDYYKNNPISGNREDICLRLLKNSSDNKSNFIIGSSRSHAYKIPYWCEKINRPKSTAFHYDGSGMGLFRATNAIKYLSKNHTIDHLLLIMDTDFFGETSNKTGHLFVQPSEVSNESDFLYYATFIKASMDYKFIFYNLVYHSTGEYYDFMGHHLIKSKSFHASDNSTGDLWYANDNDIKSDSVNYYSKLIADGVFYERNQAIPSKPLIGPKQLELLNEIKDIVSSENINLKIVISPLYNQLELSNEDERTLWNLFGRENVYDFSGKNDLTEDFTNYYENSHYKPYVANQILDSVYKSTLK